MLSNPIFRSLIHFSVDGWSCVPSLLFTWDQTMVEIMKIMATSFKRSHAGTATLSAPNPAAGLHWRLLDIPGKSGSVSCGVTAPFSWVLVHTRFCLCPPRVCFPVLCKFWWLYGGLMVTSSKRTYAIPRSAAPRTPAPAGGHCRPVLPQEMLTHSSLSVSVGSWVLRHTRFV